jgi:hypothetical protein
MLYEIMAALERPVECDGEAPLDRSGPIHETRSRVNRERYQRRVLELRADDTKATERRVVCAVGTAGGEPAGTTDETPAAQSAGLPGQVESYRPSSTLLSAV